MLVIGKETLDVIDELQAEQFITRLDAWLRQQGLLAAADVLDPLGDVDRVVERARRLELHSELAIARYAILACLFGEDFEALTDSPIYAQLAPEQDEKRDPDWIERIFRIITERSIPDEDS